MSGLTINKVADMMNLLGMPSTNNKAQENRSAIESKQKVNEEHSLDDVTLFMEDKTYNAPYHSIALYFVVEH